MTTDSTETPTDPGWYPYPGSPNRERRWDGEQWTGEQRVQGANPNASGAQGVAEAAGDGEGEKRRGMWETVTTPGWPLYSEEEILAMSPERYAEYRRWESWVLTGMRTLPPNISLIPGRTSRKMPIAKKNGLGPRLRRLYYGMSWLPEGTEPGNLPPGWYPETPDGKRERYWDGYAPTRHVREWN